MSDDQDKRKNIIRLGLIQGAILFLGAGATIMLKPELLGMDTQTANMLGPILCLVGVIDLGMAWFLPNMMNKGKK